MIFLKKYIINNENSERNNIAYILSSALILYFFRDIRLDSIPYLDTNDYIKVFNFSVIIFALPSFVKAFVSKLDKWYVSIYLIQIYTLLFLSVIGILIGYNTPYISYILLILSSVLLLREFIIIIKSEGLLTILGTTLFISFFTLLYFTRGYQFPHFIEKVIWGNAHYDTLYYSSLSNIFSNYLIPSTGYDGLQFVKYHWGSSILFAGYKNLLNINTVLFYNLAYPSIFIPLFFKSIISYFKAFNNSNAKNSLFFVFVLCVIYYLLKYPYFINAQPLISESFALSLLISFLLLAFFTTEIFKKIIVIDSVLIISVLLILLVISFIKISTGIIVGSILGYYFLRKINSLSGYIALILTSILLGSIVYYFIFPEDRLVNQVSTLNDDIIKFIKRGHVLFTLVVPLFVLLFTISNTKLDWRNIKEKNTLKVEILLLLFVISLVLGMAVLNGPSSDLSYVLMVQFFILFPYLSSVFYSKYRFSNIRNITFAGIILIGVLAYPYHLTKDFMYKNGDAYRKMDILKPNHKLMKELINDLFIVDKISNKNDYCVFIPHSENWYYNSQLFANSIGSSMVVPAFSGLATIDGVRNLNYNYYGYYYFYNNNKINLTDKEAFEKAKLLGFKKIIKYYSTNNKLVKQIIEL